MPDDPHKQSMWLSLARYSVSFVFGVVAAAFIVGGRSQKIHDLSAWKDETAPVIKRMDTTGTLSFELFHKEYERTQARQEEKLKELEKEIKELQRAR